VGGRQKEQKQTVSNRNGLPTKEPHKDEIRIRNETIREMEMEKYITDEA
jgi:hypothetical protein